MPTSVFPEVDAFQVYLQYWGWGVLHMLGTTRPSTELAFRGLYVGLLQEFRSIYVLPTEWLALVKAFL